MALESDGNHPAVLTDSEGRFAIVIASQVLAMLSVSKTGYATTSVAASDDVEIRVPKGAAITGRVVDDAGVPSPLTIVVADRRMVVGGRVQFKRQAAVESDDTGEYRLFGLPAGDYVVGSFGGRVISTAGGPPVPVAAARSPLGYFPNVRRAEQAQLLALRAGTEIGGIDFTIPLPPSSTGSPSRPAPRGRSGAIRGRVVGADGLPERRARVQLSPADQLLPPTSTFTDDDGRYDFANVLPGRYLIAVTDTRFTTARFGQRRPSDRGNAVTVSAGAVTDDIDISIPRNSVMMGRIVDAGGDPIENANVRVEQVRWSAGRNRLVTVNGVASRQTDDLGHFRIFGLSPGRYVVSAAVGQPVLGRETNDLPGYVRTYFPGTPIVSEAQAIEVADGEDAVNIEFGLVHGHAGRISGQVFRADGHPLNGTVHLIASHRSGAIATAAARTRTDDGSFEFDHLPPGEYVIQAATSYESPSIEGEFGVQFVTVTGTDIDDITVRTSVGSSIVGRVTFEGDPPQNPMDVELSPVPSDVDFHSLADNPVARAELHDDWSFEMHGVNGPRRLMLTHAPDGWMLKTIYVNGVDVTDVPIQFGTKTQSVSDAEVLLTNRITEIAGVITDDRGRPFSDAAVVVFATSRSRWYAKSRFVRHTDATLDGTFRLRGLPPGNYYVAGIDKRDTRDASGEIDNPEFLQGLAAGAARVVLTDSQRATAVLRLSSR